MSVDESVLGHGANGGPSIINRPSSMLARVSSSAAVLSTTAGNGGAAPAAGAGGKQVAPGKGTTTIGKDGKVVNAAPRRVLGDLSNANKVS